VFAAAADKPPHRPLATVETSSLDQFRGSEPPPLGDAQGEGRELNLWRLLNVQLRANGASKSQRVCCRRPITGKNIQYTKNSKGEFKARNLFRCSSALCVMCGRNRARKFATSVETAIKQNAIAGGKAFFVTLTVQTDKSKTIKNQYELLSASYRDFSLAVRKRVVGADKSKKVGFSWSYDITFKNGDDFTPHLHIHSIFYTSFDCSISQDDMFNLWEASVRKNSSNGYYVSNKAFYFDKIEDYSSASKYISKLMKIGLEVGATGFKKQGFMNLVQSAETNKKAMRVYSEVLSTFRNKSYNHIGLYASAIVKSFEAESNNNETIQEEDTVLAITVPNMLHGMLADLTIIDALFKSMRSMNNERIISYFDMISAFVDDNESTLGYEGMKNVIYEWVYDVFLSKDAIGSD
jgi:hypothetical protein